MRLEGGTGFLSSRPIGMHCRRCNLLTLLTKWDWMQNEDEDRYPCCTFRMGTPQPAHSPRLAGFRQGPLFRFISLPAEIIQ